MKLSLTLSALAATVYAKTALLVPYYISPYVWKADWDALIDTIDKHPALDFYVIVNDGNGPPYSSTLAEPGSPTPKDLIDWANHLGKVNARSNAKTIGYVYTGFGGRDVALVKKGIDDYAQWKTQKNWDGVAQDISIHGIFFDEINTDPAQLQRNLDITKYAKSVFGGKGGPVILNPGVAVQAGSESLFDAADSILNLETCYTKDHDQAYDGKDPRCHLGYTPFTPASLDALPSNSSRVAKSSVVIHDFYETWNPYVPASKSTFETDATAIVKKGVHSFYVAQYGYQGNFTMGPASISEVARVAAAAQGIA
ncbi:Spherulation-specific family 4 [Cordyceps fumosorosea ARSEF 2679]|uniref:Spherulation-specific family 4 n=1 Tax=Cordyceps fumosorosea (strain ARSEF 2679) TaxID=1081104 RepID=A0A167KSX9_CORFA|nr:Spherulation-specific family 4 [Cordyceps fumosorosea ARSEF 2679]OAA52151.1 Spherulation-specific family 4 [Cordyceps fumosorosea ARSEF 2679]